MDDFEFKKIDEYNNIDLQSQSRSKNINMGNFNINKE